jgi:hypothetical protein
VADSFEHSNEQLDSIKDGEYFDSWAIYEIRKKVFATCSYIQLIQTGCRRRSGFPYEIKEESLRMI